jgi:hypothetical protein
VPKKQKEEMKTLELRLPSIVIENLHEIARMSNTTPETVANVFLALAIWNLPHNGLTAKKRDTKSTSES